MNKTNTSIPVLERSGVAAIKDGDKASMLNKYFSECFNMAQPSLSENQRVNLKSMVSVLWIFCVQRMWYIAC